MHSCIFFYSFDWVRVDFLAFLSLVVVRFFALFDVAAAVWPGCLTFCGVASFTKERRLHHNPIKLLSSTSFICDRGAGGEIKHHPVWIRHCFFWSETCQWPNRKRTHFGGGVYPCAPTGSFINPRHRKPNEVLERELWHFSKFASSFKNVGLDCKNERWQHVQEFMSLDTLTLYPVWSQRRKWKKK